jgi:hypothetical protein
VAPQALLQVDSEIVAATGQATWWRKGRGGRIDATWERVVGKLNAHQPYLKDFLAPDKDILAAFVYFQLHGAPTILDRSLIDP